jgi:hypothetical protein
MATRNLILAVTITLALPFVNARAADLPSLDELLKQYKELGLPLPPIDAKLVRYQWTQIETINGKSQERKYYGLAFQFKPATDSKGPSLLRGVHVERIDKKLNPQEASPEPSAADGVRIEFADAIVIAAQCHSRGWNNLAQRILEISQTDKRKSPVAILTEVAWDFWLTHLTEPRTDRAPIAQRLKRIVELNSKLRSRENLSLIKSLELAIVPSKGRPGSIESLIDKLIDLSDEDLEIREDDEFGWRPNPRFQAILARGFEAVPALIEHLNDSRLTRLSVGGVNIRFYRVGDAVSDLLKGLIGRPIIDDWDLKLEGGPLEPAKARNWFEGAQKVGEERYFVDHVLVPVEGQPNRATMNNLQLFVIQARYPNRLAEIYRRVLDRYPKSDPLFAEIVNRSKLPDKEKRDVLVYAAKNREASQRWSALKILRTMDKRQFNALLLAALEALPTDVAEWLGGGPDELRLIALAQFCDDPKVWPEIEKVARKATIGFRVMILRELRVADQNNSKKPDRVQVLASFLNDPDVYDRDKHRKQFPFFEPSEYSKIEVRDFAALTIAEMLGIKVETNPKRTPEEWAKLRSKVREELNRAEKK